MTEVVAQPGELDARNVLIGDAERLVHVAQMGGQEAGEVTHACDRLASVHPQAVARTETVLEAVVGCAGKDIVGEAELLEVPQALKVFARRVVSDWPSSSTRTRTYR